jgi:hypothetical protein
MLSRPIYSLIIDHFVYAQLYTLSVPELDYAGAPSKAPSLTWFFRSLISCPLILHLAD